MSDGTLSKETKAKTRAKTRYLRAKKDRRKHRRAADRETDAKADLSNVHFADDAINESVLIRTSHAEDGSTPIEQIPRKRRKVHHHEQEEIQISVSEDNQHSLPALEPTLPLFPVPIRPDAPSKSDLAFLGLDKAFIDASIVDSKTIMRIYGDSDKCPSGLTERARKRLMEVGITELFAVQTALLPFLLEDSSLNRLYISHDAPRDVCVSAPTGSGKTLAYALPIIEILSSRTVTQLRALVVLPTRDLVNQVREVFESLCKGRGLKIASISGQHSFMHEQAQLTGERSFGRLYGGSSKVDILICTPGRLIDHLNGTQNFSLQHLRFLVIDEADRLLAQSFQDWLARVLAATRPPHEQHSMRAETKLGFESDAPIYPDLIAPAFLPIHRDIPDVLTDFYEPKESSCQKLLFSATLTKDPGKIAALQLKDPKYFIVQSEVSTDIKSLLAVEHFSMPSTLTEHMIICSSSQKPLMLFHLIHSKGIKNALIFTKSAESTIRLVRLFEFFEDAFAGVISQDKFSVCAYSSDLAPSERKGILEAFKAQGIDILVCSDLISRGVDINHVSHVVSYDAPVDLRKYVHRVGRTARAGRHGDAWTLVEEQEARYFKSLMKDANHLERLRRIRIAEDCLDPLLPSYEVALTKLRDLYI